MMHWNVLVGNLLGSVCVGVGFSRRGRPRPPLNKPNSVRPRRLRPVPARMQQLLLPTSAERLVELNECQQLITSSLGEAEFGAEQIAIRIQRVQQCVDAAAVP
jgi:hypothetical protein